MIFITLVVTLVIDIYYISGYIRDTYPMLQLFANKT